MPRKYTSNQLGGSPSAAYDSCCATICAGLSNRNTKLFTSLSCASFTSRAVTGSLAIDPITERMRLSPATVFSARICAPAKN